MSKPRAVIAGDIHYSLSNLELADTITRMAIAKANELNVPFIANGDTQDHKANLRAEYVNAMIETFKTAKIKPYVNIGNHCKIHSKSIEHALNFLQPYAHVIDRPAFIKDLNSYIIPYHDDPDELRRYLKTLPKNQSLIMHQGLEKANMGDYTRDASALNPVDVAGHRVVASHYHARQTIKLPGNGVWDFVGSPYTVSYGEHADLPKGFQILMDDGSLEFIPTNLRKHVVYELNIENSVLLNLIAPIDGINPDDLIWIKVTGSKEILQNVTKDKIARHLGLSKDFRLDLIPADTQTTTPVKPKNNADLMDSLIDSLTETSDDRKTRLKELWRRMESN